MSEKKKRIITDALKTAHPYLKEFIETGIKKKYVKEDEIDRILSKLKDVFANIKNAKFKNKVKEFLLELSSIEYDFAIDDKALSRCVRILKKDIIKKKEQEKLAEFFAGDIAERWRKIKKEDLNRVENFLAEFSNTSNRKKYLIKNLPDIIVILLGLYLEKISEKSIKRILKLIKEILDKMEYKEPIDVLLKTLSKIVVEELNIEKYLIRSLSGVLISNLILYSLGKILGIKEKLSSVDFVIVVGIKTVETQVFKKLSLEEIKSTREEIIKILEK